MMYPLPWQSFVCIGISVLSLLAAVKLKYDEIYGVNWRKRR